MTARIHIYVSGRVQGVGFRFSTEIQARRLGLNGWARNLSDGRVEAEFEGPREALEQMLAWCRKGPAWAQVTDVESEWSQGEAAYTDFFAR